MKTAVKRIFFSIIFIMCMVSWILFLNSKLDFLPQEITIAVDNLFSEAEDETMPIDISEYIFLSTLSNSPIFKNMDLLVPDETCMPSEEEIATIYSGLYSDSVVASFTNYDIILQNYGIEITDDINLKNFRDQIVLTLNQNRPNISFDTSRSITIDDLEVPVIEFFTKNGEQITYSFIALVNVDGELLTIAVNSVDTYINSYHFFNTLIGTMIIK